MTDGEIRIAIAEACGKLHQPEGSVVELIRWEPQCDGVFMRVKFQDGGIRALYVAHLSDYLNDLNAMREAVQAKSSNQYFFLDYQRHLLSVVTQRPYHPEIDYWLSLSMFDMVNASARQRAEAFLRAIGKWKE